MYVLSWRTVSALTRVLLWCLFPLLLRNSGNKHQYNPLMSAGTVRHSSTYFSLYIQCTTDISRNLIYHGCMLDPIFWHPRAQFFSRNCGNTLEPICGRQFFAKSAHRDSLCSRFAGDNFSRNQLQPTCQCGLEPRGWNTCCAMVSQARRSIDTIVLQSRVRLI